MIRLDVPANRAAVNVAQLVAELQTAAGTDAPVLHPFGPDGTTTGGQIVLDAPAGNASAAQQALDAHQPAPPAQAGALLDRLAAVESELRGMRERAAAVTATGGAAAVRDAITGPRTST